MNADERRAASHVGGGGGTRALPSTPLWTWSRFLARPVRVVVGVIAMLLMGVVFGVFASSNGSMWGMGTCVGGLACVTAAVGFRNPLGAPVAFGGDIAIFVGGLWETPFRGAIALLALVSSLWVVDCFWRRDNEITPDVFD